MKITVKTALCTIFAATLILCVSCGKKGQEGNGDTTAFPDGIPSEGVVGEWRVPESEWLQSGMAEIWVFTDDGRYFHRQTDGHGNITGEIEGTYILKGTNLTLTVSGWTQPACTVAFPDNDTMTYTNHEKTLTLKRK